MADIKGLMQVLVVLKSGRQEQSLADELVRMLGECGVPVHLVVTNADKRFFDLSQETGLKPKGMTKRVWWRQLAQEIKEEDSRRIADLLPEAPP